MKALITAAVVSAVVLASMQANAMHRRAVVFVPGPLYVPTATCVTNATKAPLPEYVCCKMKGNNGKVAWRNNWVSGGCATIGAGVAFGCTTASPVYGTGAPIIGQCQFSHSTNKLANMSYYKSLGYYKGYRNYRYYYYQ